MYLFRLYLIILIGQFFFIGNYLQASSDWLSDSRFERYTWKKSLMKGIVKDIVQDKDGHLWLAGQNGVIRYDGYEIISYQVNSGSPSPVVKMIANEQGDIFVENKKGDIFKYSRARGLFTLLDLPPLRIASGDHSQIHFLDKNNYLFKFDSKNKLKKLTYISSFEQNTTVYDSLVLDDYVLLATSNGLVEIKTASSEVVVHFIDDRGAFYAVTVWNDKILLGGEKQLYYYEPLSKKLKELLQDKHVINTSVYSLLNASNGNLWVGTYQSGIYILNKDYDIIEHVVNDKLDMHSIPSNNVFSFYEDKFENIWVGTDGGVARYNDFENNWNHVRKNSANNLLGNSISQITADSHNRIWIGTHHDGVSVFSSDGRHVKNFSKKGDSPNQNKSENIRNNSIYNLYPHSDGAMWIGHHAGIERVDLDNLSVKNIELEKKCNTSAIHAFSIQEAYGDTWIGTEQNGLIRLREDGCRIYSKNIGEKYALETNTISEIYRDVSGKIWLATPKDLYLYNSERDHFKKLSEMVDEKDMISNAGYNTLIQAASNEYWIGTAGHGILIFNSKLRTLENLTAVDGLKNQHVNGLKIQNDMVFTSTNDGLYAIERKTRKLISFTLSDGLQEDEFNFGASYLTNKGDLIFGGINGFNIFSSDIFDRQRKQAIPQIAIASNVRGQVALVSGETKKSPPLTLYHDDFPITLSLKSIHLANGDSNKIGYRFDDDKKWLTAKGSSRLVYKELDYGLVRLSVRASADKAPWSSQIAILELNVIPPPWKTKWAYSTYLIVVMSILYQIYSWRVRTIKNHAVELEKQVLERTTEIAEQKKTIEVQYKELDKVSSEQTRFFENISHEFRTPLTLILGPVRKLLKLSSEKETTSQLKVVNRNAARLLNLIDQLLDISRLNSGLKTITTIPIALSSFVDELLSDFQTVALSADVSLINEIDVKLSILFDAESLQRILINLVSNAIKYNRPGGKVHLYCQNTDNLELVISDTGIGIDQSYLGAIFERFSRVENSQNVVGTGIGLALVKELITLNGSSIQVQSEPDKGTIFSIQLQQTKLRPVVNIEQTPNQTIVDTLPTPLKDRETSSKGYDGLRDQTSNQKSDIQILIVDDDNDMRNYVVTVLQSYNCTTAENGETALSVAIDQVPDLIVTDAMMPVMDGFELVRQLRDNPVTNHIPILILTARGSQYSRLEGLQTGTDDYLTKPFDELELCQRIDNLLNSRRLLREKFSSALHGQNTNNNVHAQDRSFTEKLNRILINHFADAEFTVTVFAKEFAMSERQLQRKLKAISGSSPMDTIKRFRLHQAKLMLLRGQSVSATCYAVGFSSLSHFSRAFKEVYRVAPSNFK